MRRIGSILFLVLALAACAAPADSMRQVYATDANTTAPVPLAGFGLFGL